MNSGLTVDDVTTVITSTGRALLSDALQTVLDQSGFTTKPRVIVCSSGTDALVIKTMLEPFQSKLEIKHLHEDELISGNAARNRGIAEVESNLVAMLDDDDIWHPNKLEIQVEIANQLLLQGHRKFLILTEIALSNQELIHTKLSSDSFAIPDVMKYLFTRDFSQMRFQTFQSSTFLFNRNSYPEIGFDESTSRHTDWGFGNSFSLAKIPVQKASAKLVLYRTSHVNRVTNSTNFASLHEWWVRNLQEKNQSKRVIATYLITVPLALYCNNPTKSLDLVEILKHIPITGIRPFTAFHAIRSLTKLAGRKLLPR